MFIVKQCPTRQKDPSGETKVVRYGGSINKAMDTLYINISFNDERCLHVSFKLFEGFCGWMKMSQDAFVLIVD